MKRMWRLVGPVMAVIFALACGFPAADQSAELQAEIAKSQLRIAELEAQIAGCDCPVAEAEPAPVAAPAARKAAVAAAPEPAAEPERVVPVGTGPGEIEVKTSTAVKILLDGKGVPYNIAKSAYIAKKVEPGVHVIEVESALRKVVHTQNVDVPAGQRVRLQWRELRGEMETNATVAVD